MVGYYFFSLNDPATWLETGWLLGIGSLALVIATYDLRYMEIPITLLVVSAVLTLLFLILEFHAGEPFSASRLGSGLLGGGVVALFFFSLVFASRETWMGWGDVWLGFVAGMAVGLPSALFMLTLSFALGAGIGVAGILLCGKNLKSQIPFAPFLVCGMLFTIFFPRVFPEFVQYFLF